MHAIAEETADVVEGVSVVGGSERSGVRGARVGYTTLGEEILHLRLAHHEQFLGDVELRDGLIAIVASQCDGSLADGVDGMLTLEDVVDG